MFASTRNVTLTAATLVAAALIAPGQNAQAGPLIDWLFGRPILTYPSPTVAGYPGVPVAGPAYLTPAAPVQYGVLPGARTPYEPWQYSGGAPYISARPVTAAQPVAMAPYQVAVPAAQPVVAGYAPNYRTTWNQIPLTYYRPVTTYNVAGYPAAVGQPCNTYTWQAQRVPTLVRRPWLPFSTPAYGYNPAFAAPMYGQSSVTYAPAANPPCVNCPTPYAAPLASPYPAAAAPAFGAQPAGATLSAPSMQPTPAFQSAPADQAPSLLPGNLPASPATNLSFPPESNGFANEPAVTPIPADSASSQKESDSPYRVTPIPAPDVRIFKSPEGAPQAPPLLNGRERTVSHPTGPATSVAHTSWNTPKPSVSPPAAAVVQPVTKALWNDTGWRTAK